ncbi:metal ion-dependent transcription regulator, DtxR family [Thermococcus cleftensis]|uniref:Metal ion-dependent transcription regulator, DtxR family n=1 Tax=Thermococcus cleftensis (strain DSM 27260 / KACC 17922 / CL1) TaxID=163003 RepID=I3ZT83_THECF|nr:MULTISPECIES: metal-dependent transcriptional regulator [Thermococcus]AFL94917.1 metal ion-dependent transcription regulator, DtxR family [Thermococcus cleftensis]NJE03718.1 metal-dependent transcriptional regulator [Thermococcus sp. MV11]
MEVSKREEEYLETMYILHKNKGVIRVKDIAKMMRVKPPSVVDALKKLASKGLVEYEKYDRILLTDAGKAIAEETYSKHLLLTQFFIDILGIPPEIAERDACQFEHYVSEITVNRIREFAQFIQEQCPYVLKQFLKEKLAENAKSE